MSIGKLHFAAVDYGDAIRQNEFLRRKFASDERSEKNQRTLLSLAAGLIHAETSISNSPARTRVAHTALELRTAERQTAAPLFDSLGAAKSFRGKSIVSLRHDIVRPNRDRDYRSIGLFLSPLLVKTKIALRIFDVLRSGSGDTILQICIIGSSEQGQGNGYIDLVAANGHMRWLKPWNETLPSDRTKWMGELSDFVVARPWLEAQVIFDEDNGNVDDAPWLTCRQCRRK